MASRPPASDSDQAPEDSAAPEPSEAPDAPGSDSHASASAASASEGSPGAPDAKPEPRFFRWIRGLGLVRRTGWLGGVCAAVAERTRLDPILVRGAVVVLAVLGAPVVLVYAAAWLLLPDEKGAIHALTLARGRVDGAVVAVVALVIASFLPLTQGFWWVGAAYWGEPDFAASAGRIGWTGVVIIVAIVVIVWLARRAADPEIHTVPATTDDRPETVPRPAEAAGDTPLDGVVAFAAEPGATVAAPSVAAPSVAAPVLAPPHPAAGASDTELAAWKAQQEEWKRQRAAWAAQQRAEDRARRASAQAAWAQQREAQLAERRRREPRVGGAVIGIVLGLALVAGCVVGLIAAVAVPERPVAWTVGLGVAAAVFGLALAIAGLARRRAGGLAAFAILALVAALATTPLASGRTIVPWVGAYGIDTTHSGSYARVLGSTYLWVAKAHRAPGTTVDLWQQSGSVWIELEKGAVVRVVGAVGRQALTVTTYDQDSGDLTITAHPRPVSVADGVRRYDVQFGGSGTPDVTIRLDLNGDGYTEVERRVGTPPGQTATATPTPSPTATEGAQP